MMVVLLLLLTLLAVVLLALAYRGLRRRSLDRWLVPYVLGAARRRAPRPGEPVHLLLCLADHFEPKAGKAPPEVAAARGRRWAEESPRQLGALRDSDHGPTA